MNKKIVNEDNQIKIVIDNKTVAFITYSKLENNVLGAESTYVDSEYSGQGLAKELLDELVKFARSENKLILPICSFVVSQFEKYPDKYNKIWYK